MSQVEVIEIKESIELNNYNLHRLKEICGKVKFKFDKKEDGVYSCKFKVNGKEEEIFKGDRVLVDVENNISICEKAIWDMYMNEK